MVLQIHFNPVLTEYVKKCILSVRKAYPGHQYTFVTENAYPGLPYTVGADIMRLEFASRIPDLIYVDTDCYVKSPHVPETDLPCFGGGKHNDMYYFMTNGNTELFKEAYEHAKADLPNNLKFASTYGRRIFKHVKSERILRDSHIHLTSHRFTGVACDKKLSAYLGEN